MWQELSRHREGHGQRQGWDLHVHVAVSDAAWTHGNAALLSP